MITLRRADERGHFDHGWLDTRHTFSFAGYLDPDHMGFRALRVINEDVVQGGKGFGTHPHRDMEIVTYVLEGGLAHKDSMGNTAVIPAGEVQRMTAGTGITHSEYNASATEPVHFVQIWILPDRTGHTPGYQQHALPEDGTAGLVLVASAEGRDGSLSMHQDADLYVVRPPDAGTPLTHPLSPGRHAYIQVTRGALIVNGHPLAHGDGAALSDEPTVTVSADAPAEALLFDLA